MTTTIALDCETTTYNKGNPYDKRNHLVCYSWADEEGSHANLWDGLERKRLQKSLAQIGLIVGFNFKFDYHWLAKNGVDLSTSKIWDVQIAEFILSHQTQKLPSLNQTCEKYGIPKKLDVVATEYWDKGVQTDAIPWHILSEYAAHDAYVTLQCYHAQSKLMTPAQKQLCRLMCMDMHVLREMEANGLVFDEKRCEEKSKEVDDKIAEIKGKLAAVYPNIPISFSSGDDLSAFLYGGTIEETVKEHVGFIKTGPNKGQPKMKNVTVEHVLPQLYKPLEGSELLKEGYYATDEATLKKLKGNKETVGLLLELAKLEKLNGTYYKGLVKLREEMHWPAAMLHGQFNQTIAGTGRLSSNKPNLHNFASEMQDIFISRFNE